MRDEDTLAPERARRLARASACLVAGTFALIVLGALVRAHGAGLACPDWPLCFGEWVPRFDFHVAFEWAHRALAGSISLGWLALAVTVWRDPGARAVAGRTLAVAGVLLAVQVVLGGLTVLLLLASWTVTAHLVTGNAFAATLLVATLSLRDAAERPERPDRTARPAVGALQRGLVTAAAAVLLLQLVLGGLVSSQYAGLACAEWPTCNQGQWFPSLTGVVALQIAHRLNGYLLLALLAAAAVATRGVPGLARATAMALVLVVLQIGVGVANVWLRVPVEVTGLHSALAAALVLLLTGCARSAWLAPLPATREAAARHALGAEG